MDNETLFLYYCNAFSEEIRSISLTLNKGFELSFLGQMFPLEIVQFINILYVKCKIEEFDSIKISCGLTYSLIYRNGLLYRCGSINDNHSLTKFEFTGIKKIDSIVSSNIKVPNTYGINMYAMYQKKDKLYSLFDDHKDKSNVISINPLQIKSGPQNTLILAKNDRLFGCGNNDYGQLGLGINVMGLYCYSFSKIDIPNVISFECGYYHTFVLTKEGLFGCGSNLDYQLGLDERETYSILTKLDINNVLSFACGTFHSLILTKEGLFFCGSFYNKSNNERSINVEYESSTRSKWVNCQYEKNFMKLPISNIISFSCGEEYSLILTRDGLYELDRSTTSKIFIHGQYLSVEVQNLRKLDLMKTVLNFSCGVNHAIVLTKEGLFGRGDNEKGQLGLGDQIHNRVEFKRIVF